MNVYDVNVRLNQDRLPVLREAEAYRIDGRTAYNTPEKLYEFLRGVYNLDTYAEERYICIALDSKCKMQAVFPVGSGTINSSVVYVRGLFQKVLMFNCACIVLAHNHPSGDPTPRGADREVTCRVKAAAELLGVNLIDHIIVGEECFHSFKEWGEI